MAIASAERKERRPGRSRGADRKQQIIRATRELVAKYGIQGTSLARIAGAVGVTDAALYKYFRSKDDMLLAAYDSMAERVLGWIGSFDDLSVYDRIRKLGESHAEMFSKDLIGFNGPMFQFNVWLPEDRIREHVGRTHQSFVSALVAVIERGKREGTVRQDADAEFIVSELYAWIWWEDLSYLRGLDPSSIERRSAEMFGRILADICTE
ncbi:MAG: TetR/AcrR family transcriptional regulator [Actinobacteria bacterium]|nr:TetR/AcrR family transcriptional regulator [Actinomycetota bacterium]